MQLGTSPLAESIAMELPEHPLGTSWSHLLEAADGTLHLIDSGADTDENLARVERAVRSRGRSLRDLATITLTHVHHDHAGLAERIRQDTGATVHMHRQDVETMRTRSTYGGTAVHETFDRWGVPAAHRPALSAMADQLVARSEFVVDGELTDGDVLELPGCRLRVMHTPGHTRGHVCLVSDEHDVAFVGDHVLADQHPGVGLGGPGATNPMRDYLAALERLAAAGVSTMHAGHGPAISAPVERIGRIREHHLRRQRAIGALLDGGRTIWQVAAALPWSAGWERLHGVQRFSALNQTDMHVRMLTEEDA